MVSRRSSSAVKKRSVVTRQDDAPKARKLRAVADSKGIAISTKIVKGRKREKSRMFSIKSDCSMELDEDNSTPSVLNRVGSSAGNLERIPESSRTTSFSTMSDAHHFGIHGGEIVSAGGDIHINKCSPSYAETSVKSVPTASSLSTVSNAESSTSRNIVQKAIIDPQFPNVIHILSTCLQGIKKRLVSSRTTVEDIMHLPVFSVDSVTSMVPEDTETYSRFMLQFRQGYPLYRPTPIQGFSETHWKKGVRIGDVGRIRPDGSFEFLFNVNPNETDTQLPEGFEKLHHVNSFYEPDYYSSGEHLLKGGVEQTRNLPITYKFSASGAILQLPEGANHCEAQNKNDFSSLAGRYAQRWYEYMNVDRSMGAPNGSLYLITGCIKCTSCATAVFSEPYISENWLEFHYEGLRARPRYVWKKMGPMTARVSQNKEGLGIIDVEEPRHCVFLRGFKITLGDKQWNQLIKIAITQSSSQDRYIEGSSSSGASQSAKHAAKGGNGISGQYTSSDLVSDNNRDTGSSPIIQQLSSSASPMHPSDLINAVLLQRNPHAKVAVAHDDDWFDLFPENLSVDPFSLPVSVLLKIFDKAFSTVVDEHGCVSLVKTHQQKPTRRSVNMKPAIERSNGKGPKVLSRVGERYGTSHLNASRAIPKSAVPSSSKDKKPRDLQKETGLRTDHTGQSEIQISGEEKNKKKKSEQSRQSAKEKHKELIPAPTPSLPGDAPFRMTSCFSDPGTLTNSGDTLTSAELTEPDFYPSTMPPPSWHQPPNYSEFLSLPTLSQGISLSFPPNTVHNLSFLQDIPSTMLPEPNLNQPGGSGLLSPTQDLMIPYIYVPDDRSNAWQAATKRGEGNDYPPYWNILFQNPEFRGDRT